MARRLLTGTAALRAPSAALQDCQLSVVKPNPRQYVARISQLPGLEVWFQRATGGLGRGSALGAGSACSRARHALPWECHSFLL